MLTMTTTKRNDEVGVDWVDLSAAAFLLLPLALFFAGWFTPLPAIVLLAAISAVFALLSRQALQRREHALAIPAKRWFFAAVAVAVIWSFFGGAGHWLYANHFDWQTRDAVLRDLTVLPWPVSYGPSGPWELILRAPVGYFLVPAALAKWTGLGSADLLLYVWTVLGLFLSILLVLQGIADRRHRWLWLALLPWFSGMDFLGWLIEQPEAPVAGLHLEWWARQFQYSSNSTLLFWVPNHALPGWIAAGMMIKHWHHPRAMSWLFAVLVAATPLWSPLVTISLAPFWLVWLAGELYGLPLQPWAKDRTLWVAVAVCTVCFYLGSTWVGQDSGLLAIKGTIDDLVADASVRRIILFMALEFGLIAWLTWRKDRDASYYVSLLVLVLLPFVTFGPNNDLSMRASIAPLSILFVALTRTIVEAYDAARYETLALCVMAVALGSITPMQEFVRAATRRHWAPDLQATVLDVSTSYPANYVARSQRTPTALAPLLREPAPVPPGMVPQAIVKSTPKR